MRPDVIRPLILFCVWFSAAIPGLAGEVEAAVDLQPLRVSGTRLREEPLRQPFAFYRTDMSELNQRAGMTALDRLNYGPGLFLQRTAPNQASPYIRGLTGEQTLLMLDGVRLSHAMMRPGPNQYSASVPEVSLGSLDVILGPSAVVNGSDGLTGALDLRLAETGRGVSSAASPWAGTRMDSGNGLTLQGGVDGVGKDWAYSVDFSRSSFHDREGGKDFRDHLFGPDRDTFDRIPNTAYDSWAAGLRLAYFGLQDHVLELKSGHSEQLDAPRPDGYFPNTGSSSRLSRFYDPQAFSYLHLRDTWEIGAPAVDQLRTTLWWHRVDESEIREDLGGGGNGYRRREADDALNAYGVDLQATTPWGGGAHELIWGTTLLWETTDNAFREFRSPAGNTHAAAAMAYRPENWSNQTTVSDGSEYTTFGLFAQDLWRITDSVQLLSGLRYSRMDWSFGEVDGDTDNLSGGLRGQWDFHPNQNVFAGFSRGFRAPNLVNLDGLSDRGSSGNFAKGNPDLKPEISLTAEGGWRGYRDRDWLQFTLFQTLIEDLIQRDFSGDGEFTNVEEAELKGFEAAWDVELAFLSGDNPNLRIALEGAVSLVDGHRDIPLEGGGTVSDPLSRANRVYGRLGLRAEQGRNWWGRLQLRWHDDYDEVSTHPSSADSGDIRLTAAGNPDGSMPGYAVADLLIGWKSEDGRTEISCFIENLVDDTYREPGSSMDGVGRNFGLSARRRF